MIAKTHRFHGYNSLRSVYQRSKTVRSAHCALKYAPNPRRRTYRAGVVVSRKVHKSAVVRNRIRRRIYEQIRLQVPPAVAYDLVFIVFHDALADMPASTLERTIRQLLRPLPGISDTAASSGAPVR